MHIRRAAGLAVLALSLAFPVGFHALGQDGRISSLESEVKQLAADWSGGFDNKMRAVERLYTISANRTESEMKSFEPVIAPLLSYVGYGGIGRTHSELAADILVRIGRPAVPALVEGLRHPTDDRLRRMSANILVRMHLDDTLLERDLLPLLADRDEHVRNEVVNGFETISLRSGLDELRTAPSLAARIPHESIYNQLRLHQLLARIESRRDTHVAALRAFLAHDDWPTRINAAERLAELQALPDDAWQSLLPGLRSSESSVRSQTAHAVGKLGMDTAEIIDALVDILNDDDSRGVRLNAAGAILEFGPIAKRAIPSLQAAIPREAETPSTTGWWIGVNAIAKVGGTDAIPILIEYLDNPDPGIRQASVQRLGEFGPAAVASLPALERRLQDEREYIRTFAADAIEHIKGNER